MRTLTASPVSYESVYCACGAQWHGKYTKSPVIEAHKLRARQLDLKVNLCQMIAHATYVKHFRCACSECKASRKRGPRGTRGWRRGK